MQQDYEVMESLKWYNQAYIYFHRCQTAGKFVGEFNYIRKEIGLIDPYVQKNTDASTST